MPSQASQLELELRASRDEVARATEAVRLYCAAHGAAEELIHDLCLAVDEVLANIVLHGYAADPAGRIELRVTAEGSGYKLDFIDRAPPFNPLTATPPDLAVPPEERTIGGLGMVLVRALMDGLAYAREGDANHLTLHREGARSKG